MIVNTKTGVLISGTIAKTPELKFVGQNNRPVLKFSVRYGSEPDEAGKRKGKYLYVDCLLYTSGSKFQTLQHIQ